MSDEELQQMGKEELLGIIKAQRFEISILKDDKEHLGEFLKESNEEIERLNNKVEELMELYTTERHCKDDYKYIINELEKWLEEQHQFIIEIPAFTKEISIEHKTMELCYENILDKLQELKGSDKE